ncbi:MAG: ABC transporter substrate-binding protein [Chloroflexales bacterium]|nr:ABC transporter substrate-binding protein [Chloroflexales bacterium]
MTALVTDAASLVVVAETADTRVIRHLFGETEIPTDLQRIVVIQDQNMFLPILELGEGDRVVGSAGGLREDGTPYFRRTQDYDTSGVTMIGGIYEPNLELITELNPDLIFSSQYEITEENYELFSAIAPTVVVEQFTRPIWGSLFDIALLVNAQDVAIAQKAAYDERVTTIQAALSDPSEITVSIIGGSPEGFFIVGIAHAPSFLVTTDLGLSISSPLQELIDAGEFSPVYSLESIQQADGDVVYVVDFDGDSAILTESPLYATLEVVQKGQAHVVDGSTHAGLSVQALNAWLDTFEETLLVDSLDTSWEPTE